MANVNDGKINIEYSKLIMYNVLSYNIIYLVYNYYIL